jgi:uncharacterized membrane protein
VKELFQGRRFGFSPRPAIAYIAVGVGVALTLADLMAWFAWGAKDTTGFVVVSYWLSLATTLLLALAIFAALAEQLDAPRQDRAIVRLDILAGLVAFMLYAASALLRQADPLAAAAAPAPFLLAVAGLVVAFIDATVAANLYSAREWEELEEEPIRERRPRRRAASR